MRLLLIAFVLALSACARPAVKSNPPAPVLLRVPVATYVPIDAALIKRCAWVRDASPSAVFEVSNGRKRCLLQYEAQLDAVGAVQGKPAPDVAADH